MNCALDHLVIAARTLDEGVDWCTRTLGIVPGAGGRHALMGTHNRVFAIGSAAFPRVYFEIIAIDPDAPDPGRARWLGLDDARLQRELAANGPRLVQWVARCTDLDASLAAVAQAGAVGGRVLAATRATPQGELHWRIAVPDDGARAFSGALPLLIEWGAMHPSDHLPDSGVQLTGLALGAAGGAAAPLRALGLQAWIATDAAAPPIAATLATPRGIVELMAQP